jgi:SUKH-4 immunity protein
MEAGEWRDVWEHGVINARGDDRLLPAAAREFLLAYGMPKVVIFECSNSFEISFWPLAEELAVYNARVRWGDFYNKELDREWSNQVVIANEDFRNGSASYCVHQEHGRVSRIDCELSTPLCFVNSSVAQFGMSLLVAKKWSANLRARDTIPTAASFKVLARDLASVDRDAFESVENHWPGLIEFVLDGEVLDFEITDDPARSKPRF